MSSGSTYTETGKESIITNPGTCIVPINHDGSADQWEYAAAYARTVCTTDVSRDQMMAWNPGVALYEGTLYELRTSDPGDPNAPPLTYWRTIPLPNPYGGNSVGFALVNPQGEIVSEKTPWITSAAKCNGQGYFASSDNGNMEWRICRELSEDEQKDIQAMTMDQYLAVAATYAIPASRLSLPIIGEEVVKGGMMVTSRVLVLASLPFLLSGDSAMVEGAIPIGSSWQDNIWYSTDHGAPVVLPDGQEIGEESKRVIEALLATSVSSNGNGPKLKNKGDGRSNGSVRLYGAIDKANPNVGHVAGMMVFNDHVAFFVLTADIQDLGHLCPKGGCINLPGGKYMDPGKFFWDCAWIMSTKDFNSHRASLESEWLSVGASWAAWERVQSRYGPLVTLAEVPLPGIMKLRP